MPAGTIRYWAAARAAAGVAEERYDAATLGEALLAARERHGAELAKVLDRCSYVVDEAPVGGRDHDLVDLTDGGTVEVLPPFAGGAGDSRPATMSRMTSDPTRATARPAPRPAGPGGRRRAEPAPSGLPATAPGLVAGLIAAALAALALLGLAPLAAGIFLVQVVLALAWLATLDARGSVGAFAIAVATAIACDLVVAIPDEPDLGRAAPVLGLAVVASLAHQLTRRPRPAVTMSIAATLSAATFALCAASYVAIRVESGGDDATAAALIGIGVALALGRIVDLVLRRPAAAPGSRRGIVGCVLGLAAAAVVGRMYGGSADALGSDHGLRIAIVAALIAVLTDLAVDSVLSAAPPEDDRSLSALAPLGMLLPVVLAGPAVYVAGRILLG